MLMILISTTLYDSCLVVVMSKIDKRSTSLMLLLFSYQDDYFLEMYSNLLLTDNININKKSGMTIILPQGTATDHNGPQRTTTDRNGQQQTITDDNGLQRVTMDRNGLGLGVDRVRIKG